MLEQVGVESDPEASAHNVLPSTMGHRASLAAGFAASSISVGTATLVTNPVDVIKVRQQLAGRQSRNLIATGVIIVREEGVLSLYRGVTAAVLRGLLYGGLRIGLYTPFKEAFAVNNGKDPGLTVKIAAGMSSGAIAAAICNPTDMVKTHMQASMANGRPGPISVAARILREEGLLALWKGTTPSMARASLLTASQCATYDEVKLFFLRRLSWKDSIGTHLAVSGIAGLVTTTVTAPVDMVKTHMFMNPSYTGPWHCVADIYRRLGVRGLFKGWGANWARQGPMTTAILVVNETLRPMLGLKGL